MYDLSQMNQSADGLIYVQVEKNTNRIEKMKFFKSLLAENPSCILVSEVFWSWLGAFLGISAVALLHYNLLAHDDLPMIIGSFGASAVLVYGVPHSPFAQPRNMIGGHVFSAIVGVLCYMLIGSIPWLACALAVSTSIAVMHVTKTLHPPGGATALIAVIGSTKIHALGFMYVLIPVASGASVMLIIALAVNRIPKSRCYCVDLSFLRKSGSKTDVRNESIH